MCVYIYMSTGLPTIKLCNTYFQGYVLGLSLLNQLQRINLSKTFVSVLVIFWWFMFATTFGTKFIVSKSEIYLISNISRAFLPEIIREIQDKYNV